MPSSAVRGALLAVVVVLAGCSGVFVSDPGPSTTRTTQPPTDAGTTTAEPTGPIGLTADGVSNPLRLASAHVRGLENRSFTVRDAQVVSAPNGTVLARTATVAQVSTDRMRFNATRRTEGGFLPLFADTDLFVYSNGTVTYVDGSTVAGGVQRTPASQSAYSGASYLDKTALYTSFSAVDTEITGAVARNGTTLFRVAGTGGNYSYNEVNATEVNVVALVDRQGVVHELHMEWRAEFGARTILVERDVAYRAIGETTVDRPEWADDGNATGGA